MENPQDDLRSALEGAFESAESSDETVEQQSDAQDAPPSKEDKQPEQVAPPARDEQGKFAKEVPETDETNPESVEEEQPAIERRPPSSWKPDTQAAFNALPQNVQDEVLRRETDYHKGIEGYKTHAQTGQAFERAVQPYMQTIQQLGVDAPTAVAQLLKADHTLRHGDPATKAQYFAQLAQQYGVDMEQVANPPAVDPQYRALQQQIQQQQAEMSRWKSDQEQQQQSIATTEIDRFAEDPDHPHFNEVRDEMALLLNSGRAGTLKDAYDTAVWMRGDIRQSLIDQQRAEAQKKATDQAQNARAKAASVSVKGSSPATGGVPPVKGSLRETIEAAFADS